MPDDIMLVMRSVVIEEGAFLGLVSSAVEVYGKETAGLLIGKRKGNSYVIKYAITYQSAKRKKTEVEIDEISETRLHQTHNLISRYGRVGDYHSHIDKQESLTKCDRMTLVGDGEGVSLLVIIKKASTGKKWQYNTKDKKLLGSIGREYWISIKAYYYDHIKRKIMKVSIRCPYIRQLNRRSIAQNWVD